MKKIALATVALLLSGSLAMAGTDKTQAAFVDVSSVNGGLNGFTNGTSSGKSKSGGCTAQIQLKGLTGLSDGALVICTGSADVVVPTLPGGRGGNSIVWRAPVKSGGINVKNSFAVIDVGGNHCGSAKTVSYNSDTRCYLPDSGYDPAAACAGAGMFWVAAPAGTVNMLGLCQGLSGSEGQRIPPPASGEIARTGMTIPLGAK